MKKVLYSILLFLFYTTGILFITTTFQQIPLSHAFILGHIFLISIIMLITKKETVESGKWNITFNNIFEELGTASSIFIFLLLVLNSVLHYGIIKKDISSIILYVIVAPICEELFFRHTLSSIIRNKSGFIWISTILFIIFHTPTHWAAVLAPLVLSLVNGWIYLKDKDIVQIILIHGFINLFVVALL